jgi:hypothetical protein
LLTIFPGGKTFSFLDVVDDAEKKRCGKDTFNRWQLDRKTFARSVLRFARRVVCFWRQKKCVWSVLEMRQKHVISLEFFRGSG